MVRTLHFIVCISQDKNGDTEAMPIINEIYYETAGEGRPVILIHCPVLHSVYWHPMMRRLQTVCKSVAFDFPGHGKSPYRGRWGFSDVAADMGMLTRELGLEKPLLVGYSSGGCVALAAVLAEPETYSGVVMIGGLSECSTLYLRTEIAVGMSMMKLGLMPALVRSVAFANRQNLKHYRAMMPLAKRVHRESLESYLIATRTCNFTPRLPEIQVPVHLVYGTWDDAMHPYYRKLRDGLSHSTTSLIPWTGHRVPTQRPKYFASIVSQFLDQISEPNHLEGPILPGDSPDFGAYHLRS